MIRLSGVAARKIAASLFDRPLPDPGCFKFGRIIVPLPNPTPLDDVVLSIYAAPHSYTGEDVVEISTHGSPVIVAELLEALYQAGARPAEPGEFTLRAYLQGRIDLTQAEAVSDLINSASLQAARSALTQLEGGIGKKCDEIATLIERLLILTELELDFVEEDVELSDRSEKISLATSAVELALNMLAGYQTARRLREGVKVVLTGAPNVGKSSLYNALIGDSRAIVHATPGTTRDVLSAKVVIGGIEFEFFDTAGLRDQPDEIEDEGIARARIAMKKADIILEIDSADIPGKFDNLNDINHIRITNKSDLGLPAPAASLPVSAQTGAGMNELRGRLLNMVQEDAKLTDGTISRERHYLALTHAIEALRRGREGVLAGLPAEMIAEEWRESLFAIDELSGKKRLDDLLNTIFARFCIGK